MDMGGMGYQTVKHIQVLVTGGYTMPHNPGARRPSRRSNGSCKAT